MNWVGLDLPGVVAKMGLCVGAVPPGVGDVTVAAEGGRSDAMRVFMSLAVMPGACKVRAAVMAFCRPAISSLMNSGEMPVGASSSSLPPFPFVAPRVDMLKVNHDGDIRYKLN